MEKLELKHLAPYLPYGLKMARTKMNGEYYANFVVLTPTFLHEQRWDKVWRPILRPLSDLTREIEVNGKSFIPIRKMFGELNEGCDISNLSSDNDMYLNVRTGQYRDVMWEDCFGVTHQFGYNESHNCFNHREYKNGVVTELNQTNQLQLFQQLFKNHFDIFGLIDAGKAIDINTLNK